MKYRKKPVMVEAARWTGEGWLALPFWARKGTMPVYVARGLAPLIVRTLEGEMKCQPGDWLIKGVNGEVYPCKPDIFEKTYEPVEDEG